MYGQNSNVFGTKFWKTSYFRHKLDTNIYISNTEFRQFLNTEVFKHRFQFKCLNSKCLNTEFSLSSIFFDLFLYIRLSLRIIYFYIYNIYRYRYNKITFFLVSAVEIFPLETIGLFFCLNRQIFLLPTDLKRKSHYSKTCDKKGKTFI